MICIELSLCERKIYLQKEGLLNKYMPLLGYFQSININRLNVCKVVLNLLSYLCCIHIVYVIMMYFTQRQGQNVAFMGFRDFEIGSLLFLQGPFNI